MKAKLFATPVVCILLFITAAARSQNSDFCLTPQYVRQHMSEDPDAGRKAMEWERQVATILQQQSRQKNSGIIITIPVAVHLLYNGTAQNISDQKILDNIATLNADFQKLNADTTLVPSAFKSLVGNPEIAFCLASTAPDGSPTSGIERRTTTVSPFITGSNFNADPIKFDSLGGFNAWPQDQYFNIWICDIAPGVQGYGAGTAVPIEYDGVVLDYATVKSGSRTLTHETGHWLGLLHSFNDTLACGDDGIADTPVQQQANSGCPSFPHVTCSNGPDGDLYVNYMDYSNCTVMFSSGQVARMQAELSHPRRSPLFTSQGCVNSTAIADPMAVPEVEIYPNPTSGLLYVSFTLEHTECVTIRIFNSLGQEVYSEKQYVDAGDYRKNIDLNRFPNGIYTVSLSMGSHLFFPAKLSLLR